MRLLQFTFFVILLFTTAYPQEKSTDISAIETLFASFQYTEVIDQSTILLNEKSISDETKVRLLELRSISFFSLDEPQNALNAYLAIRKIQPNFRFDPVNTSPKIIDFFSKIDDNLPEERVEILPQETIVRDTLFVPEQSNFNQHIAKSIILPGWGHLSTKNSVKGWVILVSSAALLGSTISATIDANNKEELYLNETNSAQIAQRYDSYNSAFKKRNLFGSAFAIVWIYTQVDLLFWHKPQQKSLTLNLKKVSKDELSVVFQYRF